MESAVRLVRAKISYLGFELRTNREFQNTSCAVRTKRPNTTVTADSIVVLPPANLSFEYFLFIHKSYSRNLSYKKIPGIPGIFLFDFFDNSLTEKLY
ncbi:hypothetical protein LNA01_07330 [Companilactobacillus nantensis]|nr:hypothetical protein LNA01_07330 [Companilactobacillus nantensis]